MRRGGTSVPVTLAFVDTAATILATTVAYGLAAHAIDHRLLGLWVTVAAGFTLTQIVDFAGAPLVSLLAEARERSRSDDVRGYLLASMLLNGMVSAVLLGICGLVMMVADGLVGEGHSVALREIVIYQGLALWLRGFGNFAQSAFLGLGQPVGKVILSVSASALLLAGVCVFVPKYGLEGLLLTQVVIGIAVGCGGVLALVGVARASRLTLRAPEVRYLREIARTGTQMIAVNGMVALQDPAAKVMVGWIMGAHAVFLYDAAGRLIQMLRIPATFIGPFAVPLLAMSNAEGERFDRLAAWHRYAKASTSVMFSGSAAVSPFVAEIWLNVKGPDFVEMFILLAVGWYVHVSSVPVHFAVLAERAYKALIRGQVIRLLCSVCGGGLLGGLWWPKGSIFGIAVGLLAETWYLCRSLEHTHRQPFQRSGFWRSEFASVAPVAVGGVFAVGYVLLGGAVISPAAQGAYLGAALLGIAVASYGNGTLDDLGQLVRQAWTRRSLQGTL